MDILFDTEYFIHASAICLQFTLKYLVDIRYGIWAKMPILFKVTYFECKKITKIRNFCVSDDVADSCSFYTILRPISDKCLKFYDSKCASFTTKIAKFILILPSNSENRFYKNKIANYKSKN